MELVIVNPPRVLPYHQRLYQAVKRMLDIIIIVAMLPVTLPLMAICVIAIRLDSPGPALFIQERIGKGGRPFQMYKFRTMQHKLDDTLHRAFMKAFVNGQVGGNDNGNGKGEDIHNAFTRAFVNAQFGTNGNGTYKPFHDSQVTRVGRLLRKTSLDELPQILNVLKGEMSLVGPRPNVPWEVEEYQPWHHERLEVLPGITGLAQVKGRSSIGFDTIVRYDIEYVGMQSILLDLKVLWWTFSAVVNGTGAE